MRRGNLRRDDALPALPIDPDLDPDVDAGADPFAHVARPRWPRLHAGVVAVIFVGGCAGGLVRYAAGEHWAASRYGFPWSTFTVNVAGAFILALLVVVATDVLGASTYLRPLVGTGFCGALTTFSSIVVTTDEMVAHGYVARGVGYLVATLLAGLAAGGLGLLLGRVFALRRRRDRKGVH